jgi:hypothetical protein
MIAVQKLTHISFLNFYHIFGMDKTQFTLMPDYFIRFNNLYIQSVELV